MCDIPVPIDDGETIVRAVFSQHLERQKLRLNLFSDYHDQSSVMRHSHMGADECKRRALAIRPGNPDLRYKGFAVIRAREIRGTGASVTDSREVYCGHAHVSTNVEVPPADDPLFANQKLQRDDRLRELRDRARYLPDPDPGAANWTGKDIDEAFRGS